MSSKESGAAFPFAGNLVENLELMRKAWSGALPQMPGMPAPGALPGITSMMVPTLDVAELDKRITDLRAVEQWLALNASMLRATIQAFEVQRNTIATLQTLGGAMAAPLAPAGGPTAEKPAAPSHGPGPAPDTAGPAPAGSPRKGSPSSSRRAGRQGGRQPAAPNIAQSPLNPAAWWTNLQDQFTRIAAAASGEAGAGSAARRPATKPPSRKPRIKPAD